jgi:ketosteroid isomerase-like protein
MNPAEMRTLVDRYIDAYNRMDIDGMLLVVHPDIEFKNISGGVVNANTRGVSDLKALAEQSLSVFSERHQAILSFEANDTRAVAAISFRAVLSSDHSNGLKMGHELTLTGRSEFEFRDGAILKITDIS